MNQPFIGQGEIFTYLFLMLGPIKLLVPFARLTQDAEPALRRQLAIRSTLISIVALIVASLIGQRTLEKWNVNVSSLLIAGGVILFLVALTNVLRPYQKRAPPDPTPVTLTTGAAMSPVAFPMIVTPYGIAVLVIVMTLLPQQTAAILGLALAVMLFNLVAMLFANVIVPYLAIPLQILGSVIGVLQVALATAMIINGTQTAFHLSTR
jgi:multiple antibiotic resistance protein